MVLSKSYLSSTHLRIEILDPCTTMDQVEKIWGKLLVKCPHAYFLSWGWVSLWLSSVSFKVDIRFVVGYLDEEPVVGFFLGRKPGLRYGVLPSRTFSLNSTGISNFDQLFVEYNTFLKVALVDLSIKDLIDSFGAWDEVIFPGVSAEFVDSIGIFNKIKQLYFLIDKTEKSYQVELQRIRDAKMDYLGLLSSNRRSQIRRSIKQYELGGRVVVNKASNLEEASVMFDEMVEFHQREWKRRSRPGAFSNQFFYGFHRNLIVNRFDSGEIQLLKIHNEGMVIGYLYNFLYQGNVLFYQSGFNYTDGNSHRPGLVSHYMAILYNASLGYFNYDFLAGEAQYKESLSTTTSSMYWLRLFRTQPRYQVEAVLHNLKQKIATMPVVMEKLKQIRFKLEADG